MEPVELKKNIYSILIVFCFFTAMVITCARGTKFDIEAVEYGEVTYKVPSMAPFLIITLILLFVLYDDRKRITFQYIANYKLWGIYFLCTLIIIFFQDNQVKNLSNFGATLTSYLILFGLLRFAYRIDFFILEDCFILLSLLMLITCILFHILQGHEIVFFPDRDIQNYDRLGGLFYYAHTAAIASITFLFSLIKYLRVKKIKYLLSVILCLIFIIATDTRSAWLATALSLLFVFLKRIQFYKLFLLSTLLYLSPNIITSFSKTSFTTNGEESFIFRVRIWAYGIKIASEKLLTGYGTIEPKGFNNFELSDKLHDPHNSILSLFIKSGLIVAVLFVFIYFKNCRTSLQYFKKDYRFLYFFWFFYPFFWGEFYNNLTNFISMYMMFTIYAFSLNPKGIIKKKQSNYLAVSPLLENSSRS